MKSANKGLLLPRVTSPASSIASPAAGLMVYDQANANLSYFNGAGWQNLTGNNTASGLYARFPRSKSFHSVFNLLEPSSQSYTFTVPAGVNKVWVEMWAGGNHGGILTTPISDAMSVLPRGGAAGDFASIIFPVIAGEILSITVGKGGTSNSLMAGDSRIVAPSGADYGVSRGLNSCTYSISFLYSEVSGLIQFITGGKGKKSNVSFEQSGATEFRKVIKGGKGGDSYLGKGGYGVQVSYLMPTSSFLSSGGNSTGGDGSTPGGGGGVGFNNTNNSGYGALGLIIMHW